jgi:F1F0 ATPase subunit 2
MSETFSILLALLAGIALGLAFFGGLWWTVRRAASCESPALLLFGSYLVRMALVLCGFYLISQGNWKRLAASLFGLLIGRILVIRLTRPSVEQGKQIHGEIRP